MNYDEFPDIAGRQQKEKEEEHMELGLAGKIALVAASSKGLGRAIATTLGKEGARLVLCGRDRDQLEQTADQISASGVEVHTIDVDLATAGGPRRFVEYAVTQTGGVDVLVTNTGGPPVGTFEEHDDDGWQRAVDLVLMSAVRLIREALPHLEQRRAGRIVNVTSISVKQPIAGLLLSNSLRAAVVGMAKTLSRELAPRGILINNVCPGRIATDRLMQLDQGRAASTGLTVEQVRLEAQQSIPLGRYGQPDEMAALVAFLASARASYITGETILCDGGLYAGLM